MEELLKNHKIVELTEIIKDIDSDIAIHEYYGYDESGEHPGLDKAISNLKDALINAREEVKDIISTKDFVSNEFIDKALDAVYGNCWIEKELESLFQK